MRYITDHAGPLLTRLKSEGASTPADLLLTVDVGNLWHAAREQVLQPLQSDILKTNIPANLRDPDNLWFGLTLRARTMVYSSERVAPEALTGYEQLGEPQWRGRLCLRTAKKVYNQSLVASMIANLGLAPTEKIIAAWVDNLAVAPFANDTQTMEAIGSGLCDVSIVNTYYFGRLQQSNPTLAVALHWANQDDRGVHVNISGGAVTRHAKHPRAAQALLEWLSGEQAQKQLAALNQEFPVNPGVATTEQLKAWGTFKADAIPLAEVAAQQTAAVQLMDRVGYR